MSPTDEPPADRSAAAEPVVLDHSLTGTGAPLVLIHGITESRATFDPLLPLLEPDFRVLAVDLRGHGTSPDVGPYDLETMAADVAATVAEVWPEDPAPLLVGHSLGGAVATAYAAKYPTAGVVNVDQSMDLAAFQEMVRSVEPMLRGPACDQVMIGLFETMYGTLPDDEIDRLRAVRVVNQDAVLGVWALLFELEPAELAAHVDRVISTPAGSSDGGGDSADSPAGDSGVAGDAGDAEMKVGGYLAVHGVDPGPDYPAWLAQRVPGAQVVIWPELGHYPHLVRPTAFVELVRDVGGVRAAG